MGCDIHVFCEKKEEGKWVAVEGPNPYDWDKAKKPMVLEGWLYNGRNYSLFGLLANVRNEGVPAIAQPKGVPEDASEEYKKYVDDWGCDLHSHSYFTLKELVEAKIPEFYTEHGMVSPETREAYLEKGITPQSWCGWTNQEGWAHMSWKQPTDEMFGDSITRMITGMQGVIGDGNPEDVRMVFAFDN